MCLHHKQAGVRQEHDHSIRTPLSGLQPFIAPLSMAHKDDAMLLHLDSTCEVTVVPQQKAPGIAHVPAKEAGLHHGYL